jgi:predicted TIM-barrel fold metal-dependent hydrolase
MIIDSHVHLKHGDAKGTEYSVETIINTMNAVGIDKSIVFAISTTTKHSIEMAQEAVGKFPDRLIPYVNVDPSYEKAILAEIDEAVSKLGFRGMKIHLGYGVPAEEVMNPFLHLASERGAPCLIDCVGRYDVVERMAENFPATKIIVAHLGKYLCKDEALIDKFISMSEAHSNIFLDVSGVVIPKKITEAIQRVGSNRVIFGTDGPHEAPDTIGFARAELDKIRTLNLNPNDEAMVLGSAIAELIRI